MWRTPGRTRAVHGVIIQQTGSLMPINPALSHVLVRIRRRPIGATVTCVVLVGGTLVSSTHVSAAEPTTNQTSTGLRSPPAQGGESASRPSNVSVTFTDGKRVVLSPSTGPTPISEGRQGSRILVAGDEGSSEPSRCEQSGVETARGERYEITIKHLDRAGKPTTAATAGFFGLDNDVRAKCVPDRKGVVKVLLPKGRYIVGSFVTTSSEGTLMVHPLMRLNKDVTILADARKAKPVGTTVERRSVRSVLAAFGYYVPNSDIGLMVFNEDLTDFDGLYAAQLGPPTTRSPLVSFVSSQRAGQGPNNECFYGLMDVRKGRFLDGYDRHVTDDQLAKVTVPVRPAEGGASRPSDHDDTWCGRTIRALARLPARRAYDGDQLSRAGARAVGGEFR